MALTSQSHLAVTDVLCIPDRTGFPKYTILATIQMIFAIPDALADEKKKKTLPPPPLPVEMDEDRWKLQSLRWTRMYVMMRTK